MAFIVSPCKGVCKFHPEHEVCVGCYRTQFERAYWFKLEEDEQIEVIQMCKIRTGIYGELEIPKEVSKE